MDENNYSRSTLPLYDQYPFDVLQDALIALGDNRIDDARGLLAKSWPFTLPSVQAKAGTRFDVLLSIFVRDNFHCRYCGIKTIFPGMIMLLSRILPDEFPCGPNWAWFDTHPAVRLYTATLDHIHPRVRGGADSVENLVTACWKCNLIKGSFLLEELDWTLREPSQEAFDGFQNLFLTVLERHPELKKLSRIRQWYWTLQKLRVK